MYVRKKINKSGRVSVQVIDKTNGTYKVLKTIGSSADLVQVEELVRQGKVFISKQSGVQSIDFDSNISLYKEVLNSIVSHKLVGIDLILGKIFDEIGFNKVHDSLFRDLVLYRLVYPKSKLKTTEYLSRFEQKTYSEDEIYRYMDKLNSVHKETIQNISYEHTVKVLGTEIHLVFYDVTTVYFEIDNEDELRKTGFSKEGKHQNPQIVLGLLVSKKGYPLAYDIFEGNKFEGHTMLPVIDGFKEKFKLKQITVVADSGLLSNDNIEQLKAKDYEFIIGARIKAEKQTIKKQILALSLKHGESSVIQKDDLKLIITYSDQRAKKDQYNREKGLKRLEKHLKSGKLSKQSVNNRGYNKFLKLVGEIEVSLDDAKILEDQKWDGLKGYLTNSKLNKNEIIENYQHLWQIEKAFRVSKTDLKIRPIYHRLQKRIEAHICLNFVAYKIYKELERQLKELKTELSPEKVIEIASNIYELTSILPNNELIKKRLILTEEQKYLQKLFNF